MFSLIEAMKKELPELTKNNNSVNLQANISNAMQSGLPVKKLNTKADLWIIDCTKSNAGVKK